MQASFGYGSTSATPASFGFGAVGGGGGVTTTTLTATVDGFIQDANPTTVMSSGFIATGQFGGSQVNRALIKFDLSSLSGQTISAAVLKLTVNGNFLGASHTVNAYRSRRSWFSGTTTTGTWNSPWTTPGASDTTNDRESGVLGTSPTLTSASSGQISITLDATLVQAWNSGAFTNNGLVLVANDESGTTLIRWCDMENATSANRPKLDLTSSGGGGSIKRVVLNGGMSMLTGGI